MEPTYNMQETARAIGCSYRQLGYWCKNNVFGPKFRAYGSGHPKEFTRSDIETAIVVARVATVARAFGVQRQTNVALLKRVVKWHKKNPRAIHLYIEVTRNGLALLQWGIPESRPWAVYVIVSIPKINWESTEVPW